MRFYKFGWRHYFKWVIPGDFSFWKCVYPLSRESLPYFGCWNKNCTSLFQSYPNSLSLPPEARGWLWDSTWVDISYILRVSQASSFLFRSISISYISYWTNKKGSSRVNKSRWCAVLLFRKRGQRGDIWIKKNSNDSFRHKFFDIVFLVLLEGLSGDLLQKDMRLQYFLISLLASSSSSLLGVINDRVPTDDWKICPSWRWPWPYFFWNGDWHET